MQDSLNKSNIVSRMERVCVVDDFLLKRVSKTPIIHTAELQCLTKVISF